MQLISTNNNEGDQQPPAQPLPEQQPEQQPKDHKMSNGQLAGKGKQPQRQQQQVSAQQLAQKNREANGTAPPTKLKPTGKASKRRFTMHRALAKLNKKQCCLRSKLNESLKSWDDMEYAERQNSVGTLDLFKYASTREQVIVIIGIVFMWYAASWQPISVFILAIMASLMGQYSKQISWLEQLNNSTETGGGGSSRSPLSATAASTTLTEAATTTISTTTTTEPAYLALSSRFSPANIIVGTSAMPMHQSASSLPAPANYESFPLLSPLYSFVAPIFDFGIASQEDNRENIKAAIHDILQHESNQFLRKSFEINGSAFLLALTQLIAFFIGMTMITWVAKKQASRVKILYFRSCLHQEVTWFEAIDSASGSGSSLNGLVEKYEDGIGMKLALLCYFLGHVALFAITAFYQMFKLAAFCMPFVLLVGLIIAYLSEWQAVAIGQQALFAKRSLQLAEEIIAAIRTVFAFNGQQKEITRYSISLQPVYRKSLIKHLYTALNTSLSKFSIFACFACYCFYAMRLFPPYDELGPVNKATVLAVMRGAEVSIVNILISIPFMEALQQSKGSIARIYAAIERRSKINPSSDEGAKPRKWSPSISFRMVQFGYADRSGPTRPRRSTLPYLNLAGSPGSGNQQVVSMHAEPNVGRRRRSLIEGLEDELAGGGAAAAVVVKQRNNSPGADSGGARRVSLCGTDSVGATTNGSGATADRSSGRRQSAAIKRMIGGEINSNYSNRRILNYFNLNIKAGQSIALVGPSGSGKSTVLSLIQRLYDITGGQILIGQNNIKDLSVSWLRNQIGVVTQEPRLFDMSIADNIRLGLSEAEERNLSSSNSSRLMMDAADKEVQIMRQVVEAAIAASAHQFIIRLPEGYNTRVGSGGVQLSGGQKQRIAIARALIRKPKILLLDESTSALDTESEAQVQKALKAASVGRTTLTVAHRLATIRHVDLIVVMYQGQVVESGSHEELIKRETTAENGPPIYRQMYEDQLRALESESSLNPDPPPVLDGGGEKQVMAESGNDLSGKKNPLARFEFGPSEKEGNSDFMDVEVEFDEDEDEDDDEDEDEDDESSSGSSDYSERVSAWQLWQFIEMPKWSSLAAAIVCLLAGLVLPMNLIAHSYLFTAFAYNDLDQLGNSLHVFGLVILSFSTFVFIVSFLQVILPGYVGEKLSTRLRVRTIDALLSKPMFYFDMDSNSAGALCDRFNSYISSIQSIAGTRVATMLEAISTLAAGAFFGFGQSLPLSLFCLSFALLVLFTTIIESRILQRESSLQQKFDAQLAHLMADALSNIKTIASLNKERFFIDKFSEIIRQREVGTGKFITYFRTFLTSLKFIMPAMSWSASMYYGCHLLVEGRIDLQTIFIALVFLPELLKARKSIERLHKMNHEFSPQVLQMLTLAQQFEQQNQLHLAQVAAASHTTPGNSFSGTSGGLGFIAEAAAAAAPAAPAAPAPMAPPSTTLTRPEGADLQVAAGGIINATTLRKQSDAAGQRPKKSISFVLEPEQRLISLNLDGKPEGGQVEEIEEDQTAAAGKQLVNRRLSNIGNLPTYMRRKSSRLNSLIPRAQARGRIEFRDVDFAYPNRPSALVLDGFSLSVAPGESVALVGSSGSGKSTCVSILEKFYDFHAGKVSLDGRDLRLMDNNWTRSQIGLVSQEPTLLSYTIGDNIRYGDNSRFVSMEEVVEAARTANIHDFIMSLPDQYDTELSTSTYSSSQLSGGQRQRIAIARALIRNAPILIFDEATSALDSRNETVVQDALNKARKGRTNLTIAHRLATVRDADKIAVLRDGKLVEVGRHEELLRNETGHYRMLWERQEGALSGDCSGQNDDINAADDDDDGDDNDNDAIKQGLTVELRRTMNDERSR